MLEVNVRKDVLHKDEALVADGGSSSRKARICLVGLRSPGVDTCELLELLGIGQRVEPIEQALDKVHLSLGERCVDPDAPNRDTVPCGGPDYVAPERTGEVRVVEDD